MNKLKYHFLGGLVFLGTIVFGYIGYTAYNSLATQTDGATITKDIWNDVINKVNTIGTGLDTLQTQFSLSVIPTGAIIAFNLSNCPTGWSEYTLARGRFLRGIDSTGTNDTIRTLGNIQTDAFQGHHHNLGGQSSGKNNIVAFQDTNLDGTYANPTTTSSRGDIYIYVEDAITDGANGTPRISNETRPKNVAVLYCVKN